uniref:DBIRD complex subunit ZNF326-like isoform X2 n=1 Tax=Petromyzon marinus TaxID=7757 RepID=A0AAJ7U5K9_PETMA|nr:DBIRD complex subunit ZNF326-like isoform X2 [Petromyzon marinus]
MYYMTSTQTVRLGPEHGSSRGFDFYEKSNFGRGPDNLDYNEMGSRDWHGREMGRPDRRRYDSSSGQHHHPRGLRRNYGGNYDAPMQEFKHEHGQSHVAEDVGWPSDAQGYRGTAFRHDNWRRAGGPSSADPGYAPGLDKRQRFGGPDYTSRLEGPQGGPRVGEFPEYSRGARAKRSIEGPSTSLQWKLAREGETGANKFKSSTSAIQGYSDMFRGAHKTWIYRCCLCKYRTIHYPDIQAHIASKMHNVSRMYITDKVKDGALVCKFIDAYIGWKINLVKQKFDKITIPTGGGAAYVERSCGRGPICMSDLDEAMEITRSTWCWACCEHMAETPAVVGAHLTSPEHIRNRTNPDAGQEIFQMFHAESKGQGPKDKARPQGTEEALGNSDSAAEESVEATDDDKVVPQKVDHNDPAKSCSVDDATEEGAVDLSEKGKGQEAGGTSVENFESEAKGVKKYVQVSDSESTIDFEHGVVVHHDENETASDPQSDREECEELDNYDDDCDYEAGEVVQIDDDVE